MENAFIFYHNDSVKVITLLRKEDQNEKIKCITCLWIWSESEIENYIDDSDALMVGPHLAYILDEVEEYKNGRDVKVILMKPEYYSTLDGAKAIDHLLEEMEK